MSRSPRKTFSPDEKHLIINFIRNNKDIIENKNNDMKLVKEKKQKWEELSQIFAVKGYERDPQRLREYYHRMKCNAKSIIRAYHKHIKYNETIPAQAPSEFDWSLFEIVREDIMEDEDENSDGNSEDVRYEYEEVETNHNKRSNNSQNNSSNNKKQKTDISEQNELELLKYKKQLELQLHEEKLKMAKEKHRTEMESVILQQKKLKMELDAATVTKIKMEKEAEKIDKEMILIQRQIENENFQDT